LKTSNLTQVGIVEKSIEKVLEKKEQKIEEKQSLHSPRMTI